MYTKTVKNISGKANAKWQDLLEKSGLCTDNCMDTTVLLYDEEKLIATGSRYENILKCIAVDPSRQGEDLTSKIITALRQDAFEAGFNHLFLYTKPENMSVFSSLFFYPIVQTDSVLLMENKQSGIKNFINSIKIHPRGTVGSCVMNCNPFTLGHRYLIETASKQCDHLFVFIVSEDKSYFPFKDRFEMVKLGTADLKNVTVVETGPYLISSATFPTYFLKDREKAEEIHCMLDIEIFSKYFASAFNITKRFVGTEPLSPMTASYNETLKKYLPQKGIDVIELPRLISDGLPISASKVRELIKAEDFDLLKSFIPKTTFDFIINKGEF